MNRSKTVLWLLRIALATVFLYAAIAATLQPYNWIGYLPPLAQTMLSAQTALNLFSLFQVVLSLWLLSGWKTSYAAIVSAATLAGIILANVTQLDILFRDFAIFFAAIALAVGSVKKN